MEKTCASMLQKTRESGYYLLDELLDELLHLEKPALALNRGRGFWLSPVAAIRGCCRHSGSVRLARSGALVESFDIEPYSEF